MKAIFVILVILPLVTFARVEKKFKTLPFEDGPLPKSAQEINPRLEFVGEINGKAFYYVKTEMDWNSAKLTCDAMQPQARMAYFDTVEESDFVYQFLPPKYYWTSAVGTNNRQNFKWENSNATIPTLGGFAFFQTSRLSLGYSAFDEGDFKPKYLMQSQQAEWSFYPLCLVNIESKS